MSHVLVSIILTNLPVFIPAPIAPIWASNPPIFIFIPVFKPSFFDQYSDKFPADSSGL